MLGQARGQFLFSRGFKRQIYCITGGEYKTSKSEPSGFQSDNSDTMLFFKKKAIKNECKC